MITAATLVYPPEEHVIIEAVIRGSTGQAARPTTQLRLRKAGETTDTLIFTLTMPGTMTSVDEAHEICDLIELGIERQLPNTSVLIHVEPEGHS